MYLLGSMAGRRGGRGRRNIFVPSAALFVLFTMSLLDAAACGGGGDARKLLQMNAVCSKNDVAIYQGPTEPLPTGIPAFTVQILNVCASNCYIMNIHITCGWFSSVHLVNPQVFRRVDYDDCVVNNGEVLSPGQSLSFQYANSFQYPLSVSSVDCS